jgi:hypothetical protein
MLRRHIVTFADQRNEHRRKVVCVVDYTCLIHKSDH